MPGSRQAPDRSAQRARTRRAIVEVATDLVRKGQQPSVTDAAAAAGVHRATAYRYFPTTQSLLAEVAIEIVTPDFDQTFAEGHFTGVDSSDAVALMDAGVRTLAELMFNEEAAFRSIVRATVDRWFAEREHREVDPDVVRQTHRFEWIDHALAPLEDSLSTDLFRRLRFALTLIMGAEALIVTRDVCRLQADEATQVMRWAATTLIQGALAT